MLLIRVSSQQILYQHYYQLILLQIIKFSSQHFFSSDLIMMSLISLYFDYFSKFKNVMTLCHYHYVQGQIMKLILVKMDQLQDDHLIIKQSSKMKRNPYIIFISFLIFSFPFLLFIFVILQGRVLQLFLNFPILLTILLCL